MSFLNLKDIKHFLINKIDFIIGLILFIFVFEIYIKFLAPSILPGDPAEFCIASYVLGIPHPTGYPIYTWIGHLFTLIPVGSIAYRLNLMSAFFGAATVSLIYALVLKITIKNAGNNSFINVYRIISVIAALSLAFAKTFWFQSEFADVYTFNSFFVGLMVLILVQWSENKEFKLLYIFFLVYGLSLGAHMSNILFLPAFLIFIVINDYKVLLKKRSLFFMFLLFSLGLSQFLYILIRASMNPEYSYISDNLNMWVWFISGQYYSQHFIFSFSELPSRISMYTDFLETNFFILSSILGSIGMWELFKRNIRIFTLLILIFLSNVGFYLNYYVYDVESMFIPSYLIFSIFIGIGAIAIVIFLKNKLDRYKKSDYFIFTKPVLIIYISLLLIIPVSAYATYNQELDQSKNTDFAQYYVNVLNNILRIQLLLPIGYPILPSDTSRLLKR